ncbi:hypothetical protein Bca101_042348 [Brassica carinata]
MMITRNISANLEACIGEMSNRGALPDSCNEPGSGTRKSSYSPTEGPETRPKVCEGRLALGPAGCSPPVFGLPELEADELPTPDAFADESTITIVGDQVDLQGLEDILWFLLVVHIGGNVFPHIKKGDCLLRQAFYDDFQYQKELSLSENEHTQKREGSDETIRRRGSTSHVKSINKKAEALKALKP